MKKFGITVALALVLAGCVSTNEEYARLEATNREANEACRAAIAAKKITSYAAAARCSANAEAPLASTWGTNADLFQLLLTQKVAIWERVDKGQLTEAQANAEVAKAKAAVFSEAQRRNNANLAVAAQQQAAMSAWNASLAASRPVTCYRMSYSTTCY